MSREPDPSPSSGPGRVTPIRVVIGVVLALTIVVGVVLASRFGSDPRAVRSPLIDQPAPPTRLTRLDGSGDVGLDDLRGHIVVVNFWAPWCVPCVTEHAALQQAATDLASQDVTVLGVVNSADVDDARTFVADRADRTGAGAYEQLVDSGSATSIDFGVLGVPETFFIDRDGIVRGKITGPVSFDDVARTVDAMGATASVTPSSPTGSG